MAQHPAVVTPTKWLATAVPSESSDRQPVPPQKAHMLLTLSTLLDRASKMTSQTIHL